MPSHPVSTYRLQIREAFDLDAAAEVVPYLRDLGVSWAYLSPLLEATPGSDHGYDVVDPTRIDPVRGGAEGLERFAAAAHETGLGILIDTVPNHMGVSEPARNPWWWDLLLRGRASPHAEAFDIDWDFGDGRVRVPILGGELDDVLANGELVVDAEPAEGATVDCATLTTPFRWPRNRSRTTSGSGSPTPTSFAPSMTGSTTPSCSGVARRVSSTTGGSSP
jgi:(1->4)-alpha-D-glucan 1-alpha-D-glucosylmutase